MREKGEKERALRKIEARKAKERADKIAAQLRLWHRSLPRGPRREGQEGGEQDHTLHMRGRLEIGGG